MQTKGLSYLVSKNQLKQFNKDYKNIFLETKKGNPLSKIRRTSLIKVFIVDTIFYFLISALCYVLYNYKEFILLGSLILIGFPLSYYFSKRITNKTALIENQILSGKLEEFISKIQQTGLRISMDVASEQESGEKPSLVIPSEISRVNPDSTSVKLIQHMNKHMYHIQHSNGFKIEQNPRTQEQERYTVFLHSAKNIETDLSENANRFGKRGKIILIIILIIFGISIVNFVVIKNLLNGTIFLAVLISLMIYVIIYGSIYPSKSEVYVKALIVQNKIPLKKIKIGAYSNLIGIYDKIKQRKIHEKNLKKYNERRKNSPTGIKKFFDISIVILIIIGVLAGLGLLIYGIIWLLGHTFSY